MKQMNMKEAHQAPSLISTQETSTTQANFDTKILSCGGICYGEIPEGAPRIDLVTKNSFPRDCNQ